MISGDPIYQLAIAKIRRDGGTQLRENGTDPETVEEYREAVLAGAKFPPVRVFKDKAGIYWLVGGFHRIEAHELAGHKVIVARVEPGELRDAILAAVGENPAHGLKRSAVDKRKAVETLLRDPEWCEWSNREIGRRCGVSDWLVKIVREAICENLQMRERTVQRGQATYTQQPKQFKEMTTQEQVKAVEQAEHVRMCPTCGRPWPATMGV